VNKRIKQICYVNCKGLGHENKPGIFHGFFQENDGDWAGPVAVVEFSTGKIESIQVRFVTFAAGPLGGKNERT